MNIYVILVVGALLFAGLAKSHFMAYEAGENAQVVKLKDANDLVTKVKDEARKGAAEAIAKIDIKRVTIQEQLQKEIQTNIVYRDCVNTPDGLRALNDALSNTLSGPIGNSELPASSPTK